MTRSIPIDADGRFVGYASVFNLPDDSGDVVMPGAFAKSLKRRNADRVRLLFQHDPKEPVGVWETIVEDGFGLWVKGRLVAGVPRADALRALIERGAIDGLSIGFRTIRATRSKPGGQRQALADRSLGNLHCHLSDDGRGPHRAGPQTGNRRGNRGGHFSLTPTLKDQLWIRRHQASKSRPETTISMRSMPS
ncbi:HK97 family phage prohead protease [Devosia algicola]|uniref:HK97 family phage prohead protease n=1 Tax=Devosia algicola TaxID=3026418 RepID=A0ABY7YN82_9HYPH|nr:HK97 family phage prohead protease [Devosia algicola]WDR02748.1 HK97 family phage prohead protease [Devosia algicola]